MVAKGGTAVLYEGIQTSLDRRVAIKKLYQNLTSDDNFTRRFILEAKAAASLDHENIVHVIDFGKHDDDYQIIMEYVDGSSLKEVLNNKHRLTCDLALAVTHQVCQGLEHAHAKGIIHRDIKPGNLMLTRYGRVKITDFGLAKLTQEGASHHTVAESLLGTPLYMSPEQAYGESVDMRSDLFSLGTVLYEMLTGEQPFLSDSCVAIINNIINNKIKPPSWFDADLPEEIDNMALTALEKNRAARYQSAAELRRDIEDYMGVVRLKEAEKLLPALLVDNSQTQVLHDTPSSISGLRRRKKRIGSILGAGLAAFLAALVAFHIDMIPGAVRSLLGPGGPDAGGLTVQTGSFEFSAGLIDPIAADSSTGNNLVAIDTQVFSAGDSVQAQELMDFEKSKAFAAGDMPDSIQVKSTAAERPVDANEPQHEESFESPKSRPEPEEKEKERIRTGWLTVRSDPWAEIFIDGVYKADTPTGSPLKLQRGAHTLECKNPKYETYTETLQIIPGELSRRNIQLKKLKGKIAVFTQAGCEFYLDGKLAGITPLTDPIVLEIGRHQLTLKKNGFNSWTSEIKIEADKTFSLKITLSPKF